MQWCFVLAAVVAVVSGGHRVRYDGTPLDDNVVVMIGGGNSGRPVFGGDNSGRSVFGSVAPAVPHNVFPFTGQPQPVFTSPIKGPVPCGYGAGSLVHETYNGRREYHFSWCYHPGQTFSHAQADHYCRSLPSDGHRVGFHPVSIEDHAEDAFISTIISTHQVPYIWTSGKKASGYAWKWQTGAASLYTNWSHTGSLSHPQPDNAAGDEDCLAVLNYFYGDGITWHDVSCRNEHYVICERPKAYGS